MDQDRGAVADVGAECLATARPNRMEVLGRHEGLEDELGPWVELFYRSWWGKMKLTGSLRYKTIHVFNISVFSWFLWFQMIGYESLSY